MNRRIVMLNLILLALLGSLGWLLRAHWLDAKAKERAVLARAPKKVEQLPPPPVPAPATPVAAAQYLDVAQKMLFAKDRNPNVILPPPPPPPPEPKPEPMPALPVYHGQMAITADPVVLLSIDKGKSKGYHAGEEVGPFTLVSFDKEKITLAWKDQTNDYRFQDLKAKENDQPAAVVTQGPQLPVNATPMGSTPNQKTVSKIGDQNQQQDDALPAGNDDVNWRSCKPGDKTAAGTVIRGFKKSVTNGMFGQECHWEPTK